MTTLPAMRHVKTALTKVGSRTPKPVIHQLKAAVNYVDTGRWMRDRGFQATRVGGKREVFAAVAAELGTSPLYLEFGVYEGESLREWLTLLPPNARAVAFDSFEGLPHDWTDRERRGHFATGGPPDISDARLSFEVGLFEDTLPRCDTPPHDSLVVNVDCDLYASTKTVLEHVAPLLEPGSFLYFDEFHDRHHERKAFGEFLDETGARFECVAVSPELIHVAFRVTGR